MIIERMDQVLRDIILEMSEAELREALEGVGESFESLAESGRLAARRALDSQVKVEI